MESVNLDMGDLFDEEAMDDDDVGAVSALPDLPEYGEDDGGEGQGDNEDAENTEVLAKLKDLSKGAAKKRVSRPQPKLDATRLTGERGIPILPKVFEKVKFRGKGHEAQDLALLMRNLEHWAHRLFPKMPFDEVIERAERLGAKREVQTCVKKMRLDMPILNDDFVGSDKDDDGDDVIRQDDDNLPQAKTQQEMEEEWDELIRDAEESQASQTPPRSSSAKPGPSSASPGPSHDTPGPSHATPGPSCATPGPNQNTPGLRYDTPVPSEAGEESQTATPAQQRPASDSPFTPEQLERIERNKQLAREKRLAKLGIRSPATTRSVPGSSQERPGSQTPLSHSSQQSQAGRAISPKNQTCRNTDERNSQTQSSKNDENVNHPASDPSLNDTEDTEMSEVIRTQNDRVVVGKHQDAQDWCTEPSSGQAETENDTMTNDLATTYSRDTDKDSDKIKSRNSHAQSALTQNENGEGLTHNGSTNVLKSNTNAEFDSEEMSEVIPQITEKVQLRHKAKSQDTESVEEMSEIIPKQDFRKVSVDNNKENDNSVLNGFAGINETGDLKSKGKVLNDLDKNISVNGDSNKVTMNGTDELNEEELMDTLEN